MEIPNFKTLGCSIKNQWLCPVEKESLLTEGDGSLPKVAALLLKCRDCYPDRCFFTNSKCRVKACGSLICPPFFLRSSLLKRAIRKSSLCLNQRASKNLSCAIFLLNLKISYDGSLTLFLAIHRLPFSSINFFALRQI